jgi:hypothetical protein
MSALVNYGLIDPNLTQGAMTKGYNAYIDRGNALVQQERANKLADLQYQQTMDAENQRRALQSFMKNADPKAPNFKEGLRMIVGSQGVMDYETKQAAAKKADVEFRMKQDDFLNQFKRNASANPSPENLTRWRDIAVREGFYSEEEADDTVEQLLQMPLEERVRVLSQAGASPGELKPSTIQISRGGQTDVAQLPAFGGAPTVLGTYADVPLPENVVAQKRDIARAGGTNVNIDTSGKKYGERFGTLAAENDMKLMTTAQSAPELAATADRITDLLATGKVITGTGANARLQIAKALNLVGGNDDESIRNTEVLVSQLASTTLESIKSSGLGSGQGFTDKDREFLEKARAGQITYDASSLAELARLSRLTAEKSAETWNSRAKKIPSEALEGTGLSTDPVVIPKRGGAPIYATNGKDRIMSTDGGKTWKPAK